MTYHTLVGSPAVVVYVAVLGTVDGLVGMAGVVWAAFVVVVSITGSALYVTVGAVMMVGMSVGLGGMVVVVAVVVVGVNGVGIIVNIGPDGVPRLYARSLLLDCMTGPCFLFECLAILQKKKDTPPRRDHFRRPHNLTTQTSRWQPTL